MTLADEANEKPVTLAMPASLPECSRMSTITRTARASWTATRMALSKALLPLEAGVDECEHTILALRRASANCDRGDDDGARRLRPPARAASGRSSRRAAPPPAARAPWAPGRRACRPRAHARPERSPR